MNTLTIAVDVMGGDVGVQAIIPAVLGLACEHTDIQFQLYGESEACSCLLSEPLPHNISLTPTTHSIAMNEPPLQALRHKRESSMAKALLAVKQQQADGCISAGNTGALVALGQHLLGTFAGIDRPALCQAVPTAGKTTSHTHSYLLDLGANIDCPVEQLQQFAYLGAALSAVIDDNASPSVCLLNVGEEAFKGPAVVQAAAEHLQQDENINYQGFIEGHEIYQGVADVIVCDGFSGNIALKTSEGVANFVTESFQRFCQRNVYHRLMAFLSRSALRQWRSDMNPDRYNGAYLLGLQGTVVKSHGGANAHQFAYALNMLIHQLRQQQKSAYSMQAQLHQLLN